jgi:hypothetical protein
MAIGRKTGGRIAGTPNRKTQEIGELLESLGCNPIQGMAEIAMNSEASLELRGRMYAELAQYVYPKRRALAHQMLDEQGNPKKLEITVSYADGKGLEGTYLPSSL